MNWEERKQKLELLVGAKVQGLAVSPSKEVLKLITDKGDYTFYAVGGCCSHSWIEHINGVKNVIGGTILEMPDLQPSAAKEYSNEDWDVTQEYITTFKTDKGNLDVEHRNNSNGYYSGWLELEGDQYGDTPEEQTLTELKEDF